MLDSLNPCYVLNISVGVLFCFLFSCFGFLSSIPATVDSYAQNIGVVFVKCTSDGTQTVSLVDVKGPNGFPQDSSVVIVVPAS